MPIPAGETLLGSNDAFAYPEDGEGPVRRIRLDAFAIAPHTVTNAEFARFAEATGYFTEAERFKWSFVFGGLLPDDFPPTRGVVNAEWWRQVDGLPGGGTRKGRSRISTGATITRSCTSRGATPSRIASGPARGCRRRPSGSTPRAAVSRAQPFPWGDELEPDGEHRMNVWQGEFPARNTDADGFYGPCPVGTYQPNGYGLYNTTGNVWEWTRRLVPPDSHARDRDTNPQGPSRGTHRVARGGSYLCHASYCRRYRVAARNALTPDSSSGNVGFRCVAL